MWRSCVDATDRAGVTAEAVTAAACGAMTCPGCCRWLPGPLGRGPLAAGDRPCSRPDPRRARRREALGVRPRPRTRLIPLPAQPPAGRHAGEAAAGVQGAAALRRAAGGEGAGESEEPDCMGGTRAAAADVCASPIRASSPAPRSARGPVPIPASVPAVPVRRPLPQPGSPILLVLVDASFPARAPVRMCSQTHPCAARAGV